MEIKGIRQAARGWEVSIQRNGQRKTALCKTKAAAKVRKAELKQLLVLETSSAQVFGTFTSTITLGEAADLSLADRWANIASMDAVSSISSWCWTSLAVTPSCLPLIGRICWLCRNTFKSATRTALSTKSWALSTRSWLTRWKTS